MKYFLFFMSLTFALGSSAQSKKSRELVESGNYQEAIKPLRKEFYGKEQSIGAGLLLARAQYQLMDYEEALVVMNGIGKSRLEDSESFQLLADIYIANDDFTSAYLILLESLSKNGTDKTNLLYFNKVADLLDWDTTAVPSVLSPVSGLNSINNEYAPFMNSDKELWYVSDVNTVQSVFPAAYNNSNLYLYFKTTLRSNSLGAVQKPSMLIKKREYYYHDGPLAKWEGTNNYALTLKDIDAPIRGGRIGIYFSQMTGAEDDVTPFKYNEQYNTGHPTFTNRGKRMIFASDRPGGYGQMDLWYCDWENGAWTAPTNFGPVVNTPFNELFPTFFASRLYFSSDRQDIGYGALDLYYSSSLFDFDKVYNLRAPMNTAYDDFSITFLSDSEGYFSSNRRTGSGGDDIYSFTLAPIQENIDVANLQILSKNLPAGTVVEIYNQQGLKLMETTTIEDGKLAFQNLKSNQVYTMKVVQQDLEPEAILIAYDSKGGRYGPFKQTGAGEFMFELLSTEEYILDAQENDDLSQLIFNIKGKIVADEDAEVAGIDVSLFNQKGEMLQTVKSKENGEFNFPDVQEGGRYDIKTTNFDSYHEIDIYGNSGAIVQSLRPVGNNSFSYMRQAPISSLLRGAPLITQEVIAVIPTLNVEGSSTATLYDEDDLVLMETALDEDGFIKFQNLQAGKAYRLELPNELLNSVDKLLILGAKGDTTQTVRPFDKTNYFFEYLVYSDYSADIVEVPVEPVIQKAPIYRAKIKDFYPVERTSFLLTNLTTNTTDTLYCAANGSMVFKKLNAKDNFKLTLIEGTFDQNKTITFFDEDNKVVYEGNSKDMSTFYFTFLPEEEYLVETQSNSDESFLKMGVSGRFLEPLTTDNTAIRVFAQDGKLLAETYSKDGGKFELSGLKLSDKFILQPVSAARLGPVQLAKAGTKDSLIVVQDDDGRYYVNFAKEGAPMLVLKDRDEAVQVAAGTIFNLDNIYYDFNSYTLRTESHVSLNQLAKFMSENPGVRVNIISHTDSRGPANYNLLLSQRRAESVVNYLVKKGVAKSAVKATGKGETELINHCKDGVTCPNSEHALNRRTEFSIDGTP